MGIERKWVLLGESSRIQTPASDLQRELIKICEIRPNWLLSNSKDEEEDLG
jgi:hypothetical protein